MATVMQSTPRTHGAGTLIFAPTLLGLPARNDEARFVRAQSATQGGGSGGRGDCEWRGRFHSRFDVATFPLPRAIVVDGLDAARVGKEFAKSPTDPAVNFIRGR